MDTICFMSHRFNVVRIICISYDFRNKANLFLILTPIKGLYLLIVQRAGTYIFSNNEL